METDRLGGSGKLWTRDDAIAVMCRALARLLEREGFEGDAQAVRFAEHVLVQPSLAVVTDRVQALERENAQLRDEVARLRKGSRTE